MPQTLAFALHQKLTVVCHVHKCVSCRRPYLCEAERYEDPIAQSSMICATYHDLGLRVCERCAA